MRYMIVSIYTWLCLHVCEVACSSCAYTDIHVYVRLSEKALFLGVFGEGVFDFKAQQMKPKTWEKLTKHTNPRWLMGREKWPVDQHHRWPRSDVPCLRADLHLQDITWRKSSVCSTYVRDGWSCDNMAWRVTGWHLSFPRLLFLTIPTAENMGGYQCGKNDVRQAMTTYSLLHAPLWCKSLEGSFILF